MPAATVLQDLAIMFIDEEVREDQLQLYQDDTAPYYGQPDISRLLDSIAASCPVRTAHSLRIVCRPGHLQHQHVPDIIRVATCQTIDAAWPSEAEVPSRCRRSRMPCLLSWT